MQSTAHVQEFPVTQPHYKKMMVGCKNDQHVEDDLG